MHIGPISGPLYPIFDALGFSSSSSSSVAGTTLKVGYGPVPVWHARLGHHDTVVVPLWHARLGHHGLVVLNLLKLNNSLNCSRHELRYFNILLV